MTFYHDFDHPKVLTALLRLTPGLEELDIQLPRLTDLRNFIFDPDANDALLVPKLRKLCLVIGNTIYGYEYTISRIALTRCESISSHSYYSESTSGMQRQETLATLNSFRLVFPNDVTRLKQLKLLDRSIKKVDVPDEFFRRASVLEEGLSCTSPVPEKLHEINEIFLSLMSRPIDVLYLYVRPFIPPMHLQSLTTPHLMIQRTGIHLTLDHFVNWDCTSTECKEKDGLRRRASEILKKWEKPLFFDVPNRRWGLASDSSLFYVSIKDG